MKSPRDKKILDQCFYGDRCTVYFACKIMKPYAVVVVGVRNLGHKISFIFFSCQCHVYC